MRENDKREFNLKRMLAFVAVVVGWCIAVQAAVVDISPEGAIQTIEDGVAAARRTGAKEIRLAPGVYRPVAPIVLTSADSGLIIRGSGSDKTIVSGARLLPPLAFKSGGKNGALVADLPDFGVIDILYLNGCALEMARFPNRRAGNDRHVFGTWSLAECRAYDAAADALLPERIARWKHPETGFVHAMHDALWGGMSWRILGRDEKGGLRLEGGWQNNRPSPMHPVFRYVENIAEELDAPGEWFYDRAAGKLHLIPPAGFDVRTARFEAATLDRLFTVLGDSPEKPVCDVVFEGIAFTGTARRFMENKERMLRSDWTLDREAVLRFTNTRGCAARACAFHELGGNAVMFDGFNAHGTVERCLIRDTGANGVFFVGRLSAVREPCVDNGARRDLAALDRTPGPKSEEYPRDCAVVNCLITRTGRVEKQTSPVSIDIAARITVKDCSLYDVPRAGLNIGDGCFGGHLIEGCDVFETVLETGDHGSFNSWGRDRWWFDKLALIAENHVRFPDLISADARETVTIRGNRWRCDHGWDIDLDDGSSYYVIEDNLLLRGGLKLREGYNRTARNNLIIGNTFHLHCWLPESGDVIEGNLVMSAYSPVLMNHWGTRIDRNLFADADAAAAFRDKGCDAQSIAFTPVYKDPANGDYTVMNLPDGSPFRNLPTMDYGVKDPALRKLARKPVFPVPGGDGATKRATKDLTPFAWRGLTVRLFDGPTEFSAFGIVPETQGFVVVKAKAPFEETDIIEGENLPGDDVKTVTIIRRRVRQQVTIND